MAVVDKYEFVPMVGDPDDHRPNTTWALVVDPAGGSSPYVKGLTLLFERCARGDRIPLHTHSVEEAIVIDRGRAEVTLGEVVCAAEDGAVIFIPPGTPHGLRNVGDGVLHMHAIFASPNIPVTMIERNPAPGTEGDPPQPPAIYDARADSPTLPSYD